MLFFLIALNCIPTHSGKDQPVCSPFAWARSPHPSSSHTGCRGWRRNRSCSRWWWFGCTRPACSHPCLKKISGFGIIFLYFQNCRHLFLFYFFNTIHLSQSIKITDNLISLPGGGTGYGGYWNGGNGYLNGCNGYWNACNHLCLVGGGCNGWA